MIKWHKRHNFVENDTNWSKTFLEKRFNEALELEDAIHTALLTLKEGFEGEMTEGNVEIGVVAQDGIFKVLTDAEVRDYLDEAE